MKGIKIYTFSSGKGDFFIENTDIFSIMIKMLLKNFSVLVITFGGRRNDIENVNFLWPKTDLINYKDEEFITHNSHCRRNHPHSDFKQNTRNRKLSTDLFLSNKPRIDFSSTNNLDFSKTYSLKREGFLNKTEQMQKLSILNKQSNSYSSTFICRTTCQQKHILESCILRHFDIDVKFSNSKKDYLKEVEYLRKEHKKEFLEWKQNREGLICLDELTNLVELTNEEILLQYPEYKGILGKVKF
jgi:hypothetical protein